MIPVIGEHEDPYWTVHWRRKYGGEVKDCLLSFGLSRTWEAALQKISEAIKAGATEQWPPEQFRELFINGRFHPIPLHLYAELPGRDPEDRPKRRYY